MGSYFYLKGSDLVVKKRGRPAKEEAKRKKISVRIGAKDVEKLNFLINEKGMSYTEIFEKGLQMTYNLEKWG